MPWLIDEHFFSIHMIENEKNTGKKSEKG